MFYYCPKCGNIKNIKDKSENLSCDICGQSMQEVPREYLSQSGTFFKNQNERNRLIENIKTGTEYNADIAEHKSEIKAQKDKERNEKIEEKNEEISQKEFHVRCPVCGSTNVSKINNFGKYAKVCAFGLLGADSLGKTWKCNVCGTKF